MSLFISLFKAVSNDCTEIINLAGTLQMQSSKPAVWTALNVNCCSATGVTCVGQLVTQIDWNRMGLVANISGIILPSTVTFLRLDHNILTGNIQNTFTVGLNFLDLSGNQLTGSIPEILPTSLQYLYLGSNLLTGGIPKSLPNGLLDLSVDTNYLTGDVPSFPSSLRSLALGYPGYGGNFLTGTVSLNKPMQVYIQKNWITDVIIQDISALVNCDLSYNPLLGNFNIVRLTMCTKSGLYNANLLPITLSTSKTRSTQHFTIYTEIIPPKNSIADDQTNSMITYSSIQTSQSNFIVTSGSIIRFTASAIVLVSVLIKTPFARELRKKLSKFQRNTERSIF